jgi:hypothetical protein
MVQLTPYDIWAEKRPARKQKATGDKSKSLAAFTIMNPKMMIALVKVVISE